MDDNEGAALVTAFATLGTLTTTQQVAAGVLSQPEGGDPELVAEETLSLVSVVSARAIEAGLRETPAASRLASVAMLQLPFLYRDYLVGEAVVGGAGDVGAASDQMHARLQRKREFYEAHLAAGVFPGERLLSDKMELWMGRVSPPKTGIHPAARLDRIQAVPQVVSHAKIVLAYCRRLAD